MTVLSFHHYNTPWFYVAQPKLKIILKKLRNPIDSSGCISVEWQQVEQHATKKGSEQVPNLDKLAGKMREKRVSQVAMAKILGISSTSVNNKMTGKVEFTVEEAKLIARHLEMDSMEVHEIFF